MELMPTRHWSVGRHIRRKHTGIGEPISINTHQTRTQMNISSGWSNPASSNPSQFNLKTNNSQRKGSRQHYNDDYFSIDNDTGSLHQVWHPNTITNHFVGQNGINEDRDSPSLVPKKRGIVDDQILENLQQMFEIKRILAQNQCTPGGVPMSIGNVPQQSISGKQISCESFASYLICKDLIDNNRNVGFRGYLCTNCFSYWADLVCNNKEEGMKSLLLEKPSNHKCDAKKSQEINTLDCQDIEAKKEQACKGLSDLVTLMIAGTVLFGQKTVYLNIEELNSESPQTTLPFYRPQHWLNPFDKRHKELVMDARKRIEEQDERKEQQQPHTWIKEEDCISLGDINELKAGHWAYRAIKEKGEDKEGIVMDDNALIDFVRTARANFGTFRVQMEDDRSTRYFFMYFNIVWK